MNSEHTPVLLHEVIDLLAPKKNQNFVDATCGFGGHTEAILKLTGPKGIVIGIDQDEEALKSATERLKPFGERFKPHFGNFSQTAEAVDGLKIDGGILADLGVSSYQIDTAKRGFSFQKTGPLDMRMSKETSLTAEKIVNDWSKEEIAVILKQYADERFAVRIASAICRERGVKRLETTTKLAEIVKEAIPRKFWPKGVNPATKTFQAIRIAVNDELNQLKQFLPQALKILEPHARIAVITFHSREDYIVKKILKEEANPCTCPPDFPKCVCEKKPKIKIITKKSIQATSQEMDENPRSRSARLIVAEKINS
ncbi:MAG: 16S rRNA (cytosine(1402)-N(4))-methyltransferase RsmH [Patescibacteria group bacterium]|jgi:16S rRNA (cytosine1402-N4)-methyltransferase|nr:16S rRNA (cytosine(1402)-N(4))-methyltransferase RsmH [Patescibacteria group bacterium]